MGVQSDPQRASVGPDFYSNRAATRDSTESQDQFIKQVESSVAPD